MDKIDPKLLKRYVEGNCSEEEFELVEQWLEKEDNLFEGTEEASETELEPMYEQTMWDAFAERADIEIQKIKLWWLGLRLGSAFLLLVTIAFLYTRLNSTQEKITWLTFEVPKGKTGNLLLSDSSEVWLSGGSKLIYPQKFAKKQRELTLEYGQAFFDVRKMKDKPFVVNTDSIKINVLGTRFDVDNNVHSEDVTVALQSGSIVFKTSRKDSYILKPGQSLKYNKLNTSISAVENIETEEIGSWKSGILKFRATKLKEAFQKLEAKYGVSFKVADGDIFNRPITGKFDKMDLKNVLLLLQQSTGLQFSQQADTIYVLDK